MLMPKKIKYRKVQRGKMRGLSKGGRTLLHGDYGIYATEPAWITARQIESMRVTISRKIKKVGAMHLRIFPQKPISKKPAETRMGKGKGPPEFWAAVVKRGRIIVEISGVDEATAKQILKGGAHKLPIKTKFITKQDERE